MATNTFTLYAGAGGSWANFPAFLASKGQPAYNPAQPVTATGTGKGGNGAAGGAAAGGRGGGGGEWATQTAIISPTDPIDVFIDVDRTALFVNASPFIEAHAGNDGSVDGKGGTGGSGDITAAGGNGGAAVFLGGGGGGGRGDDVGAGNNGADSAGPNGAAGGASGDLSSAFGGNGGSAGTPGSPGDDGCGGGGGRGSATAPTAGGLGGRAWLVIACTIGSNTASSLLLMGTGS